MFSDTLLTVFAFLIPFLELLAIATAVSAIMHTRTSQGAIAWTISLVTVPFLALPLYWIFGRSKFQGYVKLRSIRNREVRHILDQQHRAMDAAGMISPVGTGVDRALVKLADMPFTRCNHLELLVDGKEAFKNIFDGILAARSYVLVQFYIVQDDELGRLLKETLVRKAGAGVRICFLYDEIGSHNLPDGYVEELCAGGVSTHAFKTTRGRANRFQLNFRNHRKLVVVDGESAFIGGHNIGDEYLSGTRRLGAWRDTLVKITGPAVQETQYSFIQDWYWATGKVPDCHWTTRPATAQGKEVLVIPSGPADLLETCGLFFVHAINSAVSRVWIASPYFVPDPQVIGALQLAALRGVDVRILLPQKPDHFLVYLASFAYYARLLPIGVKLYRYQKGFMHQKVMLVDDDSASIGTANFDNRSFRLNFEITILVKDRDFAAEVELMLQNDLAESLPLDMADIEKRSSFFKFAARASYLLAPIL